jgi:glycosyltransferase involved in cell wall biosynthesis
MRILYHHRTASKDGQAVHIDELIHALRELGHEVRVVAPSAAGPARQGAMGAEVGWVRRLRHLLPGAVYELLELAYSLLAVARLRRACSDFRPDVIYERYNLFLLSGVMLKRWRRIPMLLEVNAPLAEERARFSGLALPRLARWAEGVVWRGADVVLPVTKVLAQHVAARGVPADRIMVVPNGINAAHFAVAPEPEQAKARLGWQAALVLGFTGFVRDWHGVDRVVRWLALPGTPGNARLLIVGDGPARPQLEALAQELGVSGKVRFTGVVDRDLVPSYVASFDIALQPAVVPYASPLKLFEYLALGKAIVAPRQPNIEEVLVDGQNALLFDVDEPGRLEAALTRLSAEPALRSRLADGAQTTIARLGLTWHGNAQRVGALAAALATHGSAAALRSGVELP